MSRQSGITFLESTPERRAGVLELKIMFDEAARLREEDNIWGYANQIADIEIFYAKLNPAYSQKMASIEQSAKYTRSKGEGTKSITPGWRTKNYVYLDKLLGSIGRRLGYFEDQLRIGLEIKFTMPPGLANFE